MLLFSTPPPTVLNLSINLYYEYMFIRGQMGDIAFCSLVTPMVLGIPSLRMYPWQIRGHCIYIYANLFSMKVVEGPRGR